MEFKTFQHLNPLWREKADFIIAASVQPLNMLSDEKVREQLWARKISHTKFELCCIPFYAYGLALGDEVVTNDDYMVVDVSKKSGNTTIRIWFTDPISSEIMQPFFCKFETEVSIVL